MRVTKHDSAIDVSALRIARTPVPKAMRVRNAARHRTERFLKGPIPWHWITSAARSPGSALQVACAIWFLRGLKRKDQVKLTRATLEELGVSRYAAHRALRSLEELRLVAVVRRPGSAPLVTVLEIASTDPGRESARREERED